MKCWSGRKEDILTLPVLGNFEGKLQQGYNNEWISLLESTKDEVSCLDMFGKLNVNLILCSWVLCSVELIKEKKMLKPSIAEKGYCHCFVSLLRKFYVICCSVQWILLKGDVRILLPNVIDCFYTILIYCVCVYIYIYIYFQEKNKIWSH